MLVLGEEPQKYGLAVSLLERLYDLYQELGEVAKPYTAHLSTNFRCHSEIVNLARQVAYKSPLKCDVPDHSAHPHALFPLGFVCTSLDCSVTETNDSIDEVEVKAALKEASRFFMHWPDPIWGPRDLRQICFLSPCRGQVTAARNVKENSLPPQTKNVKKLPTYLIQGQEFRALFISTSEPTTADSETRDSTKSISDPAVFITAITRARSLVVAVGNPFMLLKREQHMVKKYGPRGHCWSQFLKACIDNGTLSLYQIADTKPLALLKEMVNQTVQHLEPLPVPEQVGGADPAPDINVIPDTPTKATQSPITVHPPEDQVLTESHEFKDHVVIGEPLGSGGFGVVCCVQNKLDKKKYALKLVRLRDRPEDQKKVMREVQALAQLDHPNIVRYYHSWVERAPANWRRISPWKHLPSSDSASYPSERATGETESQAEAPEASANVSAHISSHSSERAASEDSNAVVFEDTSTNKRSTEASNTPYSLSAGGFPVLDPERPTCLCIKTELCDRATLKTWLGHNKDGRKRLEVTTWFLEILEGVKYIHSKKLIHRDLKPSNIFFSLAATEGGRKIKIGDFGLVTTSQVAMGESALPKSKYVGTRVYMSPEQNKRENYGKEVDIYALGIIYFEMNCPFVTDSERIEVINKLRTRRSFPAVFENNLQREAHIIERMLTEDPKERLSAEKISSSQQMKNLRKNLKKNKDATIPRL
jgi:serine/threonine protein kinase